MASCIAEAYLQPWRRGPEGIAPPRMPHAFAAIERALRPASRFTCSSTSSPTRSSVPAMVQSADAWRRNAVATWAQIIPAV